MEGVAACVVISLYRFVVCKPLKITGDDALQLRPRGTLFNGNDGVEDWVVGDDVLRIDARTIVKIDFDFCDFAVSNLETSTDVDDLAPIFFGSHMLDDIAEHRIGVDTPGADLFHRRPSARIEGDRLCVLSNLH